jgi:hypothetical protein
MGAVKVGGGIADRDEQPALDGIVRRSHPDAAAAAKKGAGELVRLQGDGAIRSQKDASFYAHLIRDLDATYTGRIICAGKDLPPRPCVPTKQQRIRVPYGLTPEERRLLQEDLDDAIA